jgi:hypothetical protein
MSEAKLELKPIANNIWIHQDPSSLGMLAAFGGVMTELEWWTNPHNN